MTKKIKPMEEPPRGGNIYFTAELFSQGDGENIEVSEYTFDADNFDYRVLGRGIVFEKEEYAQRATEFIVNLVRKLEPLPGCITSQPEDYTKVWVVSLVDARYCFMVDFLHSNKWHQKALKNHMLFSSEKDARAAAKFILASLKAKVLRQNLNCLTEAPADGTPVYLNTLTPNGWLLYLFDSNSSHHMRLLELGLLYPSEEDAKRVFDILIQQINPTRPKAVPDEPDAQPDVPAKRDNDSDE